MEKTTEKNPNKECDNDSRSEKADLLADFFELFDWNSDETEKIWDFLLSKTINRKKEELSEHCDGDFTTVCTYAIDIVDLIEKYLKEERYEWAAVIFQEMVENFTP